jgi:hypothetical protein
MSQINPYRPILIPAQAAPKVGASGDRQRKSRQEHSREREQDEVQERGADDGKPHVDLKA